MIIPFHMLLTYDQYFSSGEFVSISSWNFGVPLTFERSNLTATKNLFVFLGSYHQNAII